MIFKIGYTGRRVTKGKMKVKMGMMDRVQTAGKAGTSRDILEKQHALLNVSAMAHEGRVSTGKFVTVMLLWMEIRLLASIQGRKITSVDNTGVMITAVIWAESNSGKGKEEESREDRETGLEKGGETVDSFTVNTYEGKEQVSARTSNSRRVQNIGVNSRGLTAVIAQWFSAQAACDSSLKEFKNDQQA